MLNISIKNVEELIFYNDTIQKELSDLKDYFERWKHCKRYSVLRSVAKKTIYDFLDKLNDEHVSILENHFHTSVKVVTIEHSLSKNVTIPLDELEDTLKKLGSFSNNLVINRNQTHAYISFWR